MSQIESNIMNTYIDLLSLDKNFTINSQIESNIMDTYIDLFDFENDFTTQSQLYKSALDYELNNQINLYKSKQYCKNKEKESDDAFNNYVENKE